MSLKDFGWFYLIRVVDRSQPTSTLAREDPKQLHSDNGGSSIRSQVLLERHEAKVAASLRTPSDARSPRFDVLKPEHPSSSIHFTPQQTRNRRKVPPNLWPKDSGFFGSTSSQLPFAAVPEAKVQVDWARMEVQVSCQHIWHFWNTPIDSCFKSWCQT